MITINLIAILKWYSIILLSIVLIGAIVVDITNEDFDIATILGTIIYLPILIYIIFV